MLALLGRDLWLQGLLICWHQWEGSAHFSARKIYKNLSEFWHAEAILFLRDKNDFEQGVNTSRADGINFLKICVN